MKNVLTSIFLICLLISCQDAVLEKEKEAARMTLEQHLNSVSNRDMIISPEPSLKIVKSYSFFPVKK